MSRETREVLRIARQVSEWTDGAFDVTFGALTGLWKFDAQDKDGCADHDEREERPDAHHLGQRVERHEGGEDAQEECLARKTGRI